MFDPISRTAIVAMSALCAAGAITLAPLRARSFVEFDVRRPAAGIAGSLPAVAELKVRRDPFAGEPANDSHPPVASSLPAETRFAQSSALPHGDIGPLPGNLAGMPIPAIPGTVGAAGASRVTAIVTGKRPYALVETDGTNEIKGIGDRVDGIPVVAIDITGVTLQGGKHFAVASSETSR